MFYGREEVIFEKKIIWISFYGELNKRLVILSKMYSIIDSVILKRKSIVDKGDRNG